MIGKGLTTGKSIITFVVIKIKVQGSFDFPRCPFLDNEQEMWPCNHPRLWNRNNNYFPFCHPLTPHCQCNRSCLRMRLAESYKQGLARGILGCLWPPPPPILGRPSFEQTTYNIQVAKTPWQYLGSKSHCWKAHNLSFCKVFSSTALIFS